MNEIQDPEGNYTFIVDPLVGGRLIAQEEEDYPNPIFAILRNLIDLRMDYSNTFYHYFLPNNKRVSNNEKTAHRQQMIRNRQRFLSAIARVFHTYEIPIEIEAHENFDLPFRRFSYDNYVVIVNIKDERFKRTNPALAKFGSFLPSIRFIFDEDPGRITDPQHEQIEVIDVNPATFHELPEVIDAVFSAYYDALWAEGVNPLKANNLMAESKNKSRRRAMSVLFRPLVGDPHFAWNMAKMVTEIPRRAVHPEIKNIKSNLFQGGKRKTRRRKAQKKTRKNRNS